MLVSSTQNRVPKTRQSLIQNLRMPKGIATEYVAYSYDGTALGGIGWCGHTRRSPGKSGRQLGVSRAASRRTASRSAPGFGVQALGSAAGFSALQGEHRPAHEHARTHTHLRAHARAHARTHTPARAHTPARRPPARLNAHGVPYI